MSFVANEVSTVAIGAGATRTVSLPKIADASNNGLFMLPRNSHVRITPAAAGMFYTFNGTASAASQALGNVTTIIAIPAKANTLSIFNNTAGSVSPTVELGADD